MAKRHFLHRKPDAGAKRNTLGEPTVSRLLEALRDQVIDRFVHMSMTEVQAVALAVSEPNDEDPAPNPSHPACLEFASGDYCRESWQLHLAKLKRRPETHWGTCHHQRLCAIIPITCESRCLAVIKLAGPASLDKSEFKRIVEIMELLVRDFAVSHSGFLRRVPGGITTEEALESLAGSDRSDDAAPSPTHPQVVRALDYIAAHLSDPRLSVAGVASELDLYPTYLSELFVEHMGQRMSRFIAGRRVDLAKRLLATTDWQVKRIALETGYANPNWFCHVFAVHTGLTPGQYRSAAHAQDSGTSGR
ncbi:MAG TPA: helix-turn-helix domain-containing protein [Phycisphaerae bacterium]|nr:helix-turn-helix domain-containing protein [Phycisphaerae bacterium]HSA28954.1 helix-turn-helix domain-containing protein [Phycisphaerae bacterium]